MSCQWSYSLPTFCPIKMLKSDFVSAAKRGQWVDALNSNFGTRFPFVDFL